MLAQGSGVIVHVTSIQHELPFPESTTAYGTDYEGGKQLIMKSLGGIPWDAQRNLARSLT